MKCLPPYVTPLPFKYIDSTNGVVNVPFMIEFMSRSRCLIIMNHTMNNTPMASFLMKCQSPYIICWSFHCFKTLNSMICVPNIMEKVSRSYGCIFWHHFVFEITNTWKLCSCCEKSLPICDTHIIPLS